MKNPFYTSGYLGAEYFCDRIDETQRLTQLLENGNHVVLMSPRRIGKTGLIQHIFNQKELKKQYNTFLIDIYATKNLAEFTQQFGGTILKTLTGHGEKALKQFLRIASSLRATMSFDQLGVPTWGVELGQADAVQYTLDQIFEYIEKSDKPCIIAIDEFQQITRYPEKNVEALLRTYIQHSRNSHFIFSGSERSLLGQIFHSPARPFFASTSAFPLDVIPEDKYTEFILHHFRRGNKGISLEAIHRTYSLFGGTTWYIQKVMSTLFMLAEKGTTIQEEDVNKAIDQIITDESMNYANILFFLTPRQKQLLTAISKEGQAKEIKGHKFIAKYKLPSPSTIQTSIKTLIEKQIVTENLGTYQVYDKFFSIWLNRTL